MTYPSPVGDEGASHLMDDVHTVGRQLAQTLQHSGNVVLALPM